MKRQGLLSTTGLALIVLIIGLTLHEWEDQVPLGEEREPRGPALVVEGARAHSFNEHGALRYRLIAESLNRFEKQQRTDMTAPRVEVFQTDQRWTVNADTGVLEGPDNDLLLRGNVQAVRHDGETLRLTTTTLNYLPSRNLVRAPQAVLIEHVGGTTRAGRLEADIGTGTLMLENRVESRYEAPAS